MFMKKFVSAALIAALMGTTGLVAAGAVRAAETDQSDHVTKAANKADKAQENLMKLSEDGHSAMRAIRGVRIAIFNGEPELAEKMLQEAKTALEAAEKEAPEFVMTTETSVDGSKMESNKTEGKVDMVPIDAELSVADSFVATPEKQEHIDQANQHFQKGEHEEAMEQLRLGEIDATYLRVLMPLEATKKHVETAMELEKGQKYYEANLALKAAEDGLVFDTVSLTETPKADGETSG